jgi:lipoprotein-anchoring transpeptidase ErfK/SrfK
VKKDYYSVLARAVSALDPNDSESRRGVYDRARQAMAGAPLTPGEIRQERFALEAAIRRIEAEHAGAGQAASPPAATDQFREGDIETPPRAPAAKSTSGRRLPGLLVSGLAAAAILTAGVAGYRYWRVPIVPDAKVSIQAPAGHAGRVRSAANANESDSYIFKRQMVYYRSVHPAGTVVISKSQKFLYLIRPNTAAMRYTIGIGPECSDVVGLLLVSAKEDWTAEPPKNEARPGLQAAVGRFGARSLALSDTGHRIHGAEEPVASRVAGCIPLVNDDVIDLYERVALGTRSS